MYKDKEPGAAEKVRAVLLAELEKVKTEKVSADELQKAKNQLLRSLFSSGSYTSLQRSLGRAEMLAEYTSFYKDPSLIDQDIESYLQVTAEDIQRVAAKVFTKEGVTTLDVVPAPGAKKEHSEG